MSIFNKDLIEEELGYHHDIYINIEFQIRRYFQKILSLYEDSPTCLNLVERLQSQLDNFMMELFDEDPPNFWKGPYKKVRVYTIMPFDVDREHKMKGFEVHYKLVGDLNYFTIPLIIYERKRLDIFNKVRCIHGGIQ